MEQRLKEVTPRRRGKLRRFFYALVLLVFLLAAYLWATGARQEPIDTGAPAMKAVIYTHYGSPDVLEIRDIKKPVPDDDQVLIKVRAASLNPLDWHFMEGTPYLMRAVGIGLRKPKVPRLGVDMAGVVEAVGKNVTQFKVGDEILAVRRARWRSMSARAPIEASRQNRPTLHLSRRRPFRSPV